jgi:hypothetical protein
MRFFKKIKPKTPDRFPDNVAGDFYVVNGDCLNCGAPGAEAPDLIDHSKIEFGHCYFKKQPNTEEEIERAINSIAVSCISGLRYGGNDEKILKRLYELGEAAQCDCKSIGDYKTLIYHKLIFRFDGSSVELSTLLTAQLIAGQTYLNKHIVNFKSIDDKYFEFVFRWTNGETGNIFRCHSLGEHQFQVEIGVEENGNEISIRGNAMILNDILRADKRISNLIWFDKDNNSYNETELR